MKNLIVLILLMFAIFQLQGQQKKPLPQVPLTSSEHLRKASANLIAGNLLPVVGVGFFMIDKEMGPVILATSASVGFILNLVGYSHLNKAGKKLELELNKKGTSSLRLTPSDNGTGLALRF